MHNSSYSLILMRLKLYRHRDHALKICMWFGYNPPINFCYFFRNLDLAIFQAFLTMKVNGQWVPCVGNYSYSLIEILLKLYRHCDHFLKIYMWLRYTPQVNFCHFLCNFNLVIFRTFSHLESELLVGGIVFYKHIFWLHM